MAKGRTTIQSTKSGDGGAGASKVSGRRQMTDGAVRLSHPQGGGGGGPKFPKAAQSIKTSPPAASAPKGKAGFVRAKSR